MCVCVWKIFWMNRNKLTIRPFIFFSNFTTIHLCHWNNAGCLLFIVNWWLQYFFFDEGDGVWLLVVVLFQMCQSMWSLCMCVIENKIEIEIQFMFLQIFNYSCCCCCCRFHISFVIVVLYYCLIWLSCFFYTTSGLYYQAFFLVIYLLKLDFFFRFWILHFQWFDAIIKSLNWYGKNWRQHIRCLSMW